MFWPIDPSVGRCPLRYLMFDRSAACVVVIGCVFLVGPSVGWKGDVFEILVGAVPSVKSMKNPYFF